MKIHFRGSFKRDVDKVRDLSLLIVLREKINQIEIPSSPQHVTGLKLLRGYRSHYRIRIITGNHSYRIGAVVRANTIWLVRFLPRKKIYKNFP